MVLLKFIIPYAYLLFHILVCSCTVGLFHTVVIFKATSHAKHQSGLTVTDVLCCLCLLVMTMSRAKVDELIDMK